MGEQGPSEAGAEGGRGFRGRMAGLFRMGPCGAVLLASAALVALACLVPEPARVSADRLAPFAARASAARGLPFREPVRAFLLEPDQVAGRLDREMRRVIDPAVWDAQVALLQAIGLLPPASDPWEELSRLQAGSVVGYYAALDDRLYVVARDPEALDAALADPFTAGILVHELGHALQAAHSQLLDVALGLERSDDVGFALAALLEGDALWTELRDAATTQGQPLPTPEAFAARFEADVASGLPDVSAWLRAQFLEPYPQGYTWVRHRVDAEGAAGLDRALREPPLSSAAILHPELDLRGRWDFEAGALAVPAGCRLGATNTYGEIGLRIWSDDATPRAAAGWKADRVWHLVCGEETRWAWLVAFEDAPSAALFEPAIRRRAARQAGARVHMRGARVLIEDGLAPDVVEPLLGIPTRRFASFETWLRAHPEVTRRVEQVRREAAARGQATRPGRSFERRPAAAPRGPATHPADREGSGPASANGRAAGYPAAR